MAGVGQQWERQRVGAIKEERQANFGKYLFKKACLPHFRWSVWVGKARQTSEMFATLVWPTAAIPFLAARDAFAQTRSCCCGPTSVANIWGVCRTLLPTRAPATRGKHHLQFATLLFAPPQLTRHPPHPHARQTSPTVCHTPLLHPQLTRTEPSPIQVAECCSHGSKDFEQFRPGQAIVAWGQLDF